MATSYLFSYFSTLLHHTFHFSLYTLYFLAAKKDTVVSRWMWFPFLEASFSANANLKTADTVYKKNQLHH